MLSLTLALALLVPAFRPQVAPAAPLEERAPPAVAPHGRCIEARTASLLAGACHYGGELATAGRCAVLGLRFDGGAARGLSLAGLELALVVEAPESLATDAPRRLLLYLEPQEDEARARAALAWLAEQGLVGELVALERATLSIETELEHGEAYAMRVGAADDEGGERAPRFELAGARLADRRCCAMPLAVWYDPLLAFRERVVGASERFVLDEPLLGLSFRRGGDNDVFVGRFGPGEPARAARAPRSCSGEGEHACASPSPESATDLAGEGR